MLKLRTIQGQPIYVDAAEIMICGPAFAEPNPAIPPTQQIPKIVGVMLILRNGQQSAVVGDLDEVAAEVTAAKAGIRPTLQ